MSPFINSIWTNQLANEPTLSRWPEPGHVTQCQDDLHIDQMKRDCGIGCKSIIEARISLFRYNTNMIKVPSAAGVSQTALYLLNLVNLQRVECRTRPLTSVAHSFGGIAVESARERASVNKDHRPCYASNLPRRFTVADNQESITKLRLWPTYLHLNLFSILDY